MRQNNIRFSLGELIAMKPFPFNRRIDKRVAKLMGREWNPVGDTFITCTLNGVQYMFSGHARQGTLQAHGFINPPEFFFVKEIEFDSLEQAMDAYHLTVMKGQEANNADVQHTAALSANLMFQSKLMTDSWKTPISRAGYKSDEEIEEFYAKHRLALLSLDVLGVDGPLAKRLGTGGVKDALATILERGTDEEKRSLFNFCKDFFSLNRDCPQVKEWCAWEDAGFPGFLPKHQGNSGNDKTVNQKAMFLKLFGEFIS